MLIDQQNKEQPIKPSIDSTRNSKGKGVLDRIKLIILVFIIYFFMTLLHIGCPIKFITGISCPGCGMTRAVIAALQLHFHQAFYFHPLFLLTPLMLGLFVFNDFIRPVLRKIIWIIVIVIFLVTYIIRLLFMQNDIVTIDIESGLMLQLFYHIVCR